MADTFVDNELLPEKFDVERLLLRRLQLVRPELLRRSDMSIKLHWFLPTTGDARGLVGGGHSVPQGVGRPVDGVGTANDFREADIEYLAVDRADRRAARLRGRAHAHRHLVRGRLAGHGRADPGDRNLKFLVAFRPGVTSPTLSAQMAAAFQRISNGRLLLNVVTGGEPTEQTRFGDHLDHAARYARTDEFLVGRARHVERRAVRLRRQALPGRGRQGPRRHRPAAGHLLRRLVRHRPARSRRGTPTST